MSNGNLFAELKRRNVYKVAITYSVIAWFLIEIATIILPSMEAPAGVLKGVIVFFAAGLVLAVFISWSFEATPEGLKRTENVPPNASLPTWSRRKYAIFVITVAALAGVLQAYQFFRLR
jgi:adenylate cyclase